MISIHEVGHQFRGIHAAFLVLPNERKPCCKDFFQINYEESLEDAERRFDPWLEDSIARGLAMWQRTLI